MLAIAFAWANRARRSVSSAPPCPRNCSPRILFSRNAKGVRGGYPMYQRHKIPTIFNIYMLDVICCALGCVILLWQVSHQEAESQTEDAQKQKQYYENAQADLLSASSDVLHLRATLADWQKKHK